ncbi:MAG TPA: DUF4235 domain-containing protein [Streptosporangiaceae bacterium]|jgi:hypothetical protein
MPANRADMGSRAVNALAGMAAAFVVRKAISLAWTKIMGKEPPESPEDPQVALSEAIVWGVLMGAGVGTARMLATRIITQRAQAKAERADAATS